VREIHKNGFPNFEAAKRYVQEALLTGVLPREIGVYENGRKKDLKIGWFEGDIDLIDLRKSKI